jgi:hypothetical protein
MPHHALCSDGPAPSPLPPRGHGTTYLLLQGAALSTIDEDLHRVLAAIASAPPGEAEAALVAARVPATRAPALIRALVDEGLLTSQ